MNSALANPSWSLEEALDAYITKYSLRISHSLEETAVITDARTKLMVLEELSRSNPTFCDSPEIMNHIQTRRDLVAMFNTLSPGVLAAIKKKEEE